MKNLNHWDVRVRGGATELITKRVNKNNTRDIIFYEMEVIDIQNENNISKTAAVEKLLKEIYKDSRFTDEEKKELYKHRHDLIHY